jgi:hypothetical protein
VVVRPRRRGTAASSSSKASPYPIRDRALRRRGSTGRFLSKAIDGEPSTRLPGDCSYCCRRTLVVYHDQGVIRCERAGVQVCVCAAPDCRCRKGKRHAWWRARGRGSWGEWTCSPDSSSGPRRGLHERGRPDLPRAWPARRGAHSVGSRRRAALRPHPTARRQGCRATVPRTPPAEDEAGR